MPCTMNHIILTILLMFSVSEVTMSKYASDSDTEATNPKLEREIVVLNYNIHHSNPPSKPGFIDLDAIARVIVASKAEIVGLQEVDMFTERSGSDLDMVKELSKRTGLSYFHFSKGIDFQGGEYGTAILSKYPLSDKQTIMLPAAEGTEQRTLSVVTVTLEDEKSYKFANTHLDFTSTENTLEQAKGITQYFEKEQLPVILVGDFNSVPNSDPINHLDEMFSRTCITDCAPTIPVDNPNRTIDFIMYKRLADFSVKSMEVIQEKYASDHLPVQVVLVLR